MTSKQALQAAFLTAGLTVNDAILDAAIRAGIKPSEIVNRGTQPTGLPIIQFMGRYYSVPMCSFGGLQ